MNVDNDQLHKVMWLLSQYEAALRKVVESENIEQAKAAAKKVLSD